MLQSRLQILQVLVDELLKDAPDGKAVESLMKEAGLDFHEDPIQQMNEVLKALHATPKKSAPPEVDV